jgi:hypothetical protein
MPTPKQGYYNAKGQRVPGTTTVIGRFKDSGALIHWANQLSYKPYREYRAVLDRIVETGVVSPAVLDDVKKLLTTAPDHCDYRVVRDTAATVGSMVHGRVDSHIRQREFDPGEYLSVQYPTAKAVMEASELGFQAFLQWAGASSFKLQEGEIQLVSTRYNYGGTPDVIMVMGEPTVGDWKTGDLYPQQVLPQLAAYRNLLIENNKIVGPGAHAMSINKTTGGFNHRYFTPEEVARGHKTFMLMLELYELIKELK